MLVPHLPGNEIEIGGNVNEFTGRKFREEYGKAYNRSSRASEFEKALQSAYNKQKKSMSVPGFRKGKVPRQMVEKMYGPEIFYEDAANELIPTAYEEELKNCDLEIVSRPTVDIVQIKKGENFIFTAEVAVKPEVTLGEYKGMEVDKTYTV